MLLVQECQKRGAKRVNNVSFRVKKRGLTVNMVSSHKERQNPDLQRHQGPPGIPDCQNQRNPGRHPARVHGRPLDSGIP